jgi:hypothetical protein
MLTQPEVESERWNDDRQKRSHSIALIQIDVLSCGHPLSSSPVSNTSNQPWVNDPGGVVGSWFLTLKQQKE